MTAAKEGEPCRRCAPGFEGTISISIELAETTHTLDAFWRSVSGRQDIANGHHTNGGPAGTVSLTLVQSAGRFPPPKRRHHQGVMALTVPAN